MDAQQRRSAGAPAARGAVVRRRAGAARAARPLKIVVTGPFAAGKTTFVRTISEVAIVGTDRGVSDETKSVKPRTTVALDFGRLTFADDLALFLFGTPGQRRFELMWEILSEGMIGFVLLVDATDPRSVAEAAHVLATFRAYADVPYAVAVTHLDAGADDDAGPGAVLDGVRAALDLPQHVLVTACDPRSRDDVKDVLVGILQAVLERLAAASAAAR
jgi:signal recognition particle receptor subunit beta